jgi:hypothetical protein
MLQGTSKELQSVKHISTKNKNLPYKGYAKVSQNLIADLALHSIYF